MNDSWKFHSDNTTHILFGTTSLNRFFYSQGSMNLIQEDKDFFRFHEKYLPQQFLLRKIKRDSKHLKIIVKVLECFEYIQFYLR